MIRNSLQLDLIELHILHHASEGPLYGMWMIEELARHGYRLSASNLYPRFHRLERKGLLRRRDKVVAGKLRKYYRITPQGKTYFREHKRRLLELISEALGVDELRAALAARTRQGKGKVERQPFRVG